MSVDEQKGAAALRAADLVQPGMRLGLGTGSTAALFVAELGKRVRQGLDVVGVPTSEATARQAAELGIRLATLEDEPELDLTIDGADEVDPSLRLVKGGGGALLREKLVAAASRRMVVVADAGKRVDRLGRFPLPVEIVPFGHVTTIRRIAALLSALGLPETIRLRTAPNGAEFVTDGSHWIVDLHLGSIPDVPDLDAALKSVLGVVEHGLFVGLATDALIATPAGVITMRPR